MTVWKELHDNPRLQTMYRTRLSILRLVREFFWAQNFVEADTPIALKLPGQEPYLNPAAVTFFDPLGRQEQFYLQTSPEFAMKKLLAAGFQNIFQLAKCFRNGEAFGDGTHNTEFTMLEWYRAPGTLSQIMDDLEALFKYVGKKLGVEKVKYANHEVLITGLWERCTMKQLWQHFIGINLDDYLEIEPLRVLVEKRGQIVNEGDEYEDLFFKIFLNEIEPYLGRERPVFVYEYPARMCSLSRVCSHDARYAERVEVYIGGLELANGFGELTDPAEQHRRLEQDRALRRKLGKATWTVDPDFIAALPAISPPAGGIALGVDRMVLLFTGARTLEEVVFQTVNDQLSSDITT